MIIVRDTRFPSRGPLARACPCPKSRIVRAKTRESAVPHRPARVAPIRFGACKPFLRVEKDSEKFAACNALSDQIGPLDTPKKAFRVLEEAIGDEVNEVFGVLTLDLHLRLKGLAETGRGEPSSVMAPLVPTLQAALIDGADSVIIFHVHPSGVVAEPSDADIETTEAFVDAFDVVGVNFIDHVIVGGDSRKRSYYSFAEDNAL